MTVTVTPVGVGTTPGDGTGDTARVSFTSVNTNEANFKAAIEALEGRFWTLDNTARSLAIGERVVSETHAGITHTLPASFALSATALSDIWVWNTDSDSVVTLDADGTDELFINGTGQGAGVSVPLPSGTLAICSPRVTNASWDVLIVHYAIGKQTIWIPAGAMRPTVSNGCAALTDVETTAARPDMTVLDFDATADEHCQFQIAMPKSYALGTVTFQVFWTSTAADTDGVSWGMQGVSMPDNSTIDVVYGTAIVVDDANQSAAEELLVSVESGAVTIAGTPADDDMCYFRLFRDVSDANDTATEDARLIGIKLHFTTDAAEDT